VIRGLLWALVFGLAGAPAMATPYWIAWEGEGETAGMPEECGWSRNWGNWDGQYQGPGAYRTLENAILTYDSLYDPGVCDFSYMYLQVNLGPGEMLGMAWRLKVETVTGWYRDPGVGLTSDAGWVVGLQFGMDHVASAFEDGVIIAIAPGVFHDYELRTADMLTYELYIDGELTHIGSFWQAFPPGRVGWGDFVQGAASLHHWDYFRLAVLVGPETGDVNCDATVDLRDINPFVQVLSDPAGYQETYSGCWPENADINGDGSVNFGDINPFVELLTAG